MNPALHDPLPPLVVPWVLHIRAGKSGCGGGFLEGWCRANPVSFCRGSWVKMGFIGGWVVFLKKDSMKSWGRERERKRDIALYLYIFSMSEYQTLRSLIFQDISFHLGQSNVKHVKIKATCAVYISMRVCMSSLFRSMFLPFVQFHPSFGFASDRNKLSIVLS